MSLGEKVKETLQDVFTPIVDLLLSPVKDAIEWGLESTVKAVVPNLYTYAKEVNDAVESITGSPSLKELIESGDLHDAISKGFTAGPVGSLTEQEETTMRYLSLIAAVVGSPLGLFPGLTALYMAGLGEEWAKAGRWVFQPSVLPPDISVRSLWHTNFSEDRYREEMRDQGFEGFRASHYKDAMEPKLDPDIIRQLLLRQDINTSNPEEDLHRMGWTDWRIEAMKSLYDIIPGVQDLIRMAVREAFSPEIIQKYQTAQDFPPEFAEWAKKQGLTEEWALRYWYAHWNLPSISEGFEMLHRGVITRDELETLLRTQDVMPYWREKINQIAFRPYTRVDVRRMHAYGVLNRDQVKQAYKDIGFDDDKAEKMTEFTIQYNLGTEKDLTKTEILNLFKDETLTRDEANDLLLDLDYDQETVTYLLDDAAVDASASARDLTLSQVKSLYVAGVITQGEATGRLAALNYAPEDIDRIYNLWELDTQPNISLPSRTDLANFWKAGIIDDDTWFDQMLNHGYSEEAIVWYYLLMSES